MEEEINGFFDDDGKKIDLNNIPKPGLCKLCRRDDWDDWEENLLCAMNRWDQKDEKEFECGMFEKKEFF